MRAPKSSVRHFTVEKRDTVGGVLPIFSPVKRPLCVFLICSTLSFAASGIESPHTLTLTLTLPLPLPLRTMLTGNTTPIL